MTDPGSPFGRLGGSRWGWTSREAEGNPVIRRCPAQRTQESAGNKRLCPRTKARRVSPRPLHQKHGSRSTALAAPPSSSVVQALGGVAGMARAKALGRRGRGRRRRPTGRADVLPHEAQRAECSVPGRKPQTGKEGFSPPGRAGRGPPRAARPRSPRSRSVKETTLPESPILSRGRRSGPER